jgi:hypothetical protein
MSALAPTLQAFFTDRLVRQRQASPQAGKTVARVRKQAVSAATEVADKVTGRARKRKRAKVVATVVGAAAVAAAAGAAASRRKR